MAGPALPARMFFRGRPLTWWGRAARDTDTLLSAPARWDLVVAKLFLHPFKGAQLARLMQAIAPKSDRLLACGPRRDWLALASHCFCTERPGVAA